MTDAVGKEILIEGADPRELYGPRNVYLDQMKSLHPQLRIVARGSSLKVLGSEAETRRFEERMEGLVAYYLKYGHISSQVIDQCFAGGIAAQEAPVDKDVIVYGNNGNIVRARTVNQLRLVKLYDRNDLLFAVGPAGSGKTYQLAYKYVRDVVEQPSIYRHILAVTFTNKATEDTVKLFPRDCQSMVEAIQKKLYDATGKHVEVMVYGDGAFKDPVGKIWELADPVVSPAYTAGLEGTPNELKLKYLADNDFAGLDGEELRQAIKGRIAAKDGSSLVGNMVSEGTTPRRLTDLIGSLCDLTSGSGDKGTPIVYIQGYFDNYTND